MNNTQAPSTAKEDVSIGYEIARQIGNRAFFMMGSGGTVCAVRNGLQFRVKGSKVCNAVTVMHDYSTDTYTVTFTKIRGMDFKTVKTVPMIYVDGLASLIGEVTGLALSL